MEEFTVSTYSEYSAAVEQIYGNHTADETLIVFRGQTAEYRLPDGRLALVPAAFRAAHPGGPIPVRHGDLHHPVPGADSEGGASRGTSGSRPPDFPRNLCPPL